MNVKSNLKTNLLPLLLLLLLGISTTSCKDNYRSTGGDIPNAQTEESESTDGWFTTQVTIESAGLDIPSLRALSQVGENEFDSNKVRMLVFDKDGLFHYEAKVTKVAPSMAPDDHKNNGILTLLARNSKPGHTSTFVLLTNVEPTALNATTALTEGMTMSEVMKRFTYDMPTDGSWANGQLPMWGASSPIVVNHSQGAVPTLGTIHLIRAVARVDVGLNLSKTATGASTFNEVATGITYTMDDGTEVEVALTKVYAYNTNAKGRMAPLSDDTAIWDATMLKAKAPSLPDPLPTMIGKLDKSSQIVDAKLLLREIYLPEAVNNPTKATQGANGTTLPEADQDNYLKRPFLVVGLVGADRTDPTRETFFRIDYLERTGAESTATYEYLPLLRNYRYLVNIMKVGGPGFATEAEAMKGPAANLMYNVEVWNESTMSSVQYDGQYMLGVSEESLVYYNHAHSKSLIVRTDYPTGWTASVTKGNAWLSINPNTGSANDEVMMNIAVEKNKAPDATERIGEVTITAGRMMWKVKVKQLREGDLSMKIFDEDGVTPITMLIFPGLSETKRIVVEYSPTEGIYTDVQNVSDFTFTRVTETDGRVVYDITSRAMTNEQNDFESLNDVVNFTVEDDGKKAGQALILLQTEYNAVPFDDGELKVQINADNLPLYLLDGDEKSFYIKSNTSYQLKMVENSAIGLGGSNPGNLQLVESGFTLNESIEKKGSFRGEKFTYTPFDDTDDHYKRSYGFVKFELSSPEGLFPTKSFQIMLASGKIQPEANVYMMTPKSMGVMIPVSRINTAKAFYDLNSDQFESWEQYALHGLNANDQWEPELIWSDMEPVGTKPINEDGTAGLKFIKRVWNQSGPSEYIYALPGTDLNKIGNALVACKRLSDSRTIWSWHLWVVNSYPEKIGKWLDRNIGANIVGTPLTGDVNAYGMHYHFGRKDPFPIIADNGIGNLVDANGDEFKLTQLSPKNRVRRSMRESVENPTHVVWDGDNWMRGSTNDKRLWYNIWGGEVNDLDSWTLDLHTDKTVFDPCPYGWKVPALGVESDWRNESNLVIPLTGRSYDGNISDYRWWRTYYGLSTVYYDYGNDAARTIYYPTTWEAPSLTNRYSRTMSRVIRCVENIPYTHLNINGEEDYLDYLP